MWNHVAYVYDYMSQAYRMYLDGDLVALCTGRLPLEWAADVALGPWNGHLRDVQVYKDKVLTAEQIQARVNGAGQVALFSWAWSHGYCWQKVWCLGWWFGTRCTGEERRRRTTPRDFILAKGELLMTPPPSPPSLPHSEMVLLALPSTFAFHDVSVPSHRL
jgi:hypothetical protein